MKIALIAAKTREDLIIDFSIAYSGVLNGHEIVSTGTTADRINKEANLKVEGLIPNEFGGIDQIISMIQINEINMLIGFRDVSTLCHLKEEFEKAFVCCDNMMIPYASNLLMAELLINGLQDGYLNYRGVIL